MTVSYGNSQYSGLGQTVFELADALQLVVTWDKQKVTKCLTGEDTFEVTYPNGLSLLWSLKVEDSAIYVQRSMVCALLKFGGNLWGLFMLDEGKKDEFLFLIDGAKADLAPGKATIFPPVWDPNDSRPDIFARVYTGIVGAGYRRISHGQSWGFLSKQETQEVMAKKLVESHRMTNDGVILPKPITAPQPWITKGPRGV